MGIRFFCPNGHRLNVKSFLAGKRGVCPDCGIGVDIPMESDTRANGKKKLLGSDDEVPGKNGSATAVLERPGPKPAHDDFALPQSFQLPPTASAPAPSPTPVVTNNFAFETVRPAPVVSTPAADPMLPMPVPATVAVSVAPVAVGPIAAPVAVPTMASLPVVTAPSGAAVATPVGVPAAATPVNDAIAEAPSAIWYVRPPAGGQYGPARGDVMRKWLTEGRVTNDSLVWREGWPDWRPATKVFPGLAAAPAVADAVPMIAEAPRRPVRSAKKASTASGVAIVITLGVVCVGLFVALIFVLMNSGTPTPTP